MAAGTKKKPPLSTMRCAIYCRVSSDERLGQEYNSLDAQRDAGEAFIKSHEQEGWVALPERYDDPGFSGGTMERPALKRLLADVEAGEIDVIVIYKLDRLSRSLLDFARIVETLDERGVRIVSVTQTINSGDSMGRLMLNVLLSFAQYERELAGERIRDKIRATKQRGKFLGSTPVYGYDIDRERKLVVNEKEAEVVRWIFQRFRELKAGTKIADELNAKGLRTKAWTTKAGKEKGGRAWDKGHVYRLLSNRIVLGKIVHKGEYFDGEHEAIVSQEVWDDVHRILAENHGTRANATRNKSPALLKGIIRCAHCDSGMTPNFTTRRGKRYTYYLCNRAAKSGSDACPLGRVPAGTIEDVVVDQLRGVFRAPEMVARVARELWLRWSVEIERLQAARARLVGDSGHHVIEGVPPDVPDLDAVSAELAALEASVVGEREVVAALEQLDPVWDELTPAERARVVELLIETVSVSREMLEMRVRIDGLRSLAAGLDDEGWRAAG